MNPHTTYIYKAEWTRTSWTTIGLSLHHPTLVISLFGAWGKSLPLWLNLVISHQPVTTNTLATYYPHALSNWPMNCKLAFCSNIWHGAGWRLHVTGLNNGCWFVCFFVFFHLDFLYSRTRFCWPTYNTWSHLWLEGEKVREIETEKATDWLEDRGNLVKDGQENGGKKRNMTYTVHGNKLQRETLASYTCLPFKGSPCMMFICIQTIIWRHEIRANTFLWWSLQKPSNPQARLLLSESKHQKPK